MNQLSQNKKKKDKSVIGLLTLETNDLGLAFCIFVFFAESADNMTF
jgi:hypothetical protein